MDHDWPPISLAWRQKLAAYWSIAWPSGAVAYAVAIILISALSPEAVALVPIAGLISTGAFFISQMLFVRRLTRKRYRSFRVEVEADGQSGQMPLTMPASMRVWFQIFWPQAAFYLLMLLVGTGIALMSTNERATRFANGTPGLAILLDLIVVGPYAVGFAVGDYGQFRLIAYGQRFV